MLPYGVLELRYYLTAGGKSPFESWFSDLDAAAAAKVGSTWTFPKEHAKGVSAIGHGFALPKPLIFSFGEYLDGLVAGINFDTQRAALEIDFVTPSRFTANNCMGPYEIRTPSSSMRLSVLFGEESTMTPISSARPADLALARAGL